ncbi:NmrA family NAD(P)-binding protein [Mucilaginibacter myungsuensis]|uniref:NAD(P)H-binding protein n=1 Tax=Mucilaginibacter myungsuensis TaxID=649104 RepID=A0A929KY54_9SPHI|nr:NAD(P)H-binding protein [Mucilaginibacter myungsuensis]MBE9663819.1 NAD(P)H-binding protein [Mucilaginibacter myungsuensis]MDN3598466.1 NAD(P)H-binding protein [Mucilaginibacter myungsuensis]
MKITVTGSLGNISKPLATQLIGAGHQVTIISSNADKAKEIEALGATAAIGSLTDTAFVTDAFTGADAVYTMIPPNLFAEDFRASANQISDSYVAAIKVSGVKQVVHLSSVGAQHSSGTGPIISAHDAENKLNKLDGVDVRFIRPAFFYTNFLGNIGLIKQAGILGSNYPADTRLILVHPADIATVIAREIQQPISGKSVKYVYSSEHTPTEVAAILGTAIGKPKLPFVEFTDEQQYDGLKQAGISADMSKNYVELGVAARTGILWSDLDAQGAAKGNISLEEFAKEFAQYFN